MAKDLNKIYGFRIKARLKYSNKSIAQLKKHPIKSHKCWERGVYDTVKSEVKEAFYLPQNRRCAYCRKKLNARGYFNHLDHIIPKSHHCKWMFKTKNLVITCEVCNPLKNADDTLIIGHCPTKFPKSRKGFTIFNPHFDKWEDFFVIEEGMFIRGKRPEADETIRVCKLYQENYIVQFTEEANVMPKSAIRRAALKIRSFTKGSIEYESCKKVIDYYTKLI